MKNKCLALLLSVLSLSAVGGSSTYACPPGEGQQQGSSDDVPKPPAEWFTDTKYVSTYRTGSLEDAKRHANEAESQGMIAKLEVGCLRHKGTVYVVNVYVKA